MRRHVLFAVFGTLGAGFLAGCTGQDYAAELNEQSPIPFYNIEWKSGNYSGTVKKNAITALGAPVVPRLIDVNNDNVPDVEVSLNLVDLATVANDVQAGKTVVPNVVFKRPLTAVATKAPPLKIEVVVSMPGNLIARFGYDTTRGGSIPSHLKATLIGYETGFKPFGAIVDTTNPSPTGAATTSYDGPLALIGSLRTGPDTLGLDLNFSPLPRTFRVDYSADKIPEGDLEGGTRHIRYRDQSKWPANADKTIDLDAVVKIGKAANPEPTTVVEAAIERLAADTLLDLDLRGASNSIDYRGVTTLPAPTATVDVLSRGDDGGVNDIALELVGIPETVRAEWTAVEGELSHALVTASGDGIGSASARIANYDDKVSGYVSPFPAFQPNSAMFAELRQNQDDDSLLQARVERLRRFSLDQVGKETHLGIDANDGLPLHVKVESDLRHKGKQRVDADLTTSGLPRDTKISLLETTETRPVHLEYSAPMGSQPLDIVGTIEVRDPSTGSGLAACGTDGVMCADVDAKHLPPHVLAQVDKLPSPHGSDLRIRLDADGNGLANAPRPDLAVKVITPPAENGRPTIINAALKGLPHFTHARVVDGERGGPERIELHPCRLTSPVSTTCEPGTVGTLGAAEIEVRDDDAMPKRLFDLPVTAPNHLVIISRGDRDNDEMNSRVVARAEQINRLSVLQRDGLLGIDSRLGGGKALSVDLEERGVDRPSDNRGRLDVGQHIDVPALPTSIQLCMGERDRDYDEQQTDSLTVRCEGTDPFDDGAALERSPMTFSYDANGPAAATALLSLVEGAQTETTDDDRTDTTELDVVNAPTALRAAVAAKPTSDGESAVRALVTLPNDDAAGTVVNAKVRDFARKSSCAAAAALDGDALCADVTVQGVPKALSVLFDPTQDNASGEVHACTWRVTAGGGACRPDTQGSIGRVTADLKQMKATSNSPKHALPKLVRPTLPPVPEVREQQPCALCPPEPDPRPVIDDAFAGLAMVENRGEGFAVRALLDIGSIEHVKFARDLENLLLSTDLGDVYQRLALHAVIDNTTRDDTGETLSATGLIDPLASETLVRLTTPDEAVARPLALHYEASEPIDVGGRVEIRPAAAGRSCFASNVVCAEFGLDDVPEQVDVKLVRTTEHITEPVSGERRRVTVEVDHAGSTKPDLSALVKMGPTETSPMPLEMRGALTDLPAFTRLRLLQFKEKSGADDPSTARLERLALHACDAGAAGVCPADATGSLGEASVSVRSFNSRPANFPARPTLTDAGAWVTERGDHLDAGAKIRFLRELTIVPENGRIGLRTRLEGEPAAAPEPEPECGPLGCERPPSPDPEECEEKDTCGVIVEPQAFAVHADLGDMPLEDVEFGGVEWVDATGDVKLTTTLEPLPASVSACYRPAQIPFLDEVDSLLAPCERLRPFGAGETDDDEVRANSPLALDYDASAPFDVDAAVSVEINGTDGDKVQYPTRRIAGNVELADVPRAISAIAQFPVPPPAEDPEAEPTGPTRLLYSAAAEPDLPRPSVVFSGAMTVGDAVCGGLDTNEDVACFSGHVTGIPTHLSVLAAPKADDRAGRVAAYACDRRYGLPGAAFNEHCAEGTEGEVEELQFSVHTAEAKAGALPPARAYPGTPHAAVDSRTDRAGDEVNGKIPTASATRAHILVRDLRELSVGEVVPAQGADAKQPSGTVATIGIGDLADESARDFTALVRSDARSLGGQLLDAEATVFNVAPRITMTSVGDPADKDHPLRFTYDAPSNIATTVVARAEAFDAGASLHCGDDGTMCANVRVDRLPGRLDIVMRGTQTNDDEHLGRVNARTTELNIDGPASGGRPDIEAHLVAGATTDRGPVALDADIDAVPRFVRLKTAQSRPADASRDDNEALALDGFSLDACHEEITATANPCAAAYDDGEESAGGIGNVNVGFRSFTERPDGFPATPAALVDDHNGLNLVGRGATIEAVARLNNVARLAYERAPVTLVEASAGSVKKFDATVDLTDVPIGKQRFGNQEADALLDLKAITSLNRLPRNFAFCMRPASERLVDGPTIAPPVERPDPNRPVGRCDYAAPFGTGVVPAGRTPMSVGWRASSPFAITNLDVAATIKPVEASEARQPMHLRGTGSVTEVPSSFGIHMLSPRDGVVTGPNPTRVRYEATSVIQSVIFALESKQGDAECLDARPGKRAMCVSATVSQIPKTIDFVLDPDQPVRTPCVTKNTAHLPANEQVSSFANMCFRSEGSTDFFVQDLTIRSSAPTEQDPEQDDEPLGDTEEAPGEGGEDPEEGEQAPGTDKPVEQVFMVLDGKVMGIPKQITAEFTKPADKDDKASFRFEANESIDQIEVDYRNTPEPQLDAIAIPTDRLAAGGSTPDVLVRQRGKALQARVRVDNLRAAGYAPVRAADGSVLPTERISLDFGPASRVWVYADIITNGSEDSAPSHTIADVLALNVPSGIEVCFRSRANASLPAAVNPTYCDTNNRAGGAFEFAGVGGTDPLHVDAYIRSLDPSGKVFSARINAQTIPEIIRGQFPAGDAGDVDFGGYKRKPQASTVPFNQLTNAQIEPAAIGSVYLDIADFDVQTAPYLTRPSYLQPAQPLLEAPIPAGQPKYVSARMKNGDMSIRANVGRTVAEPVGSAPGIKRFRLLRDVTTADDCNQYRSSLTTSGYPDLAQREERYTCVLADFDTFNPASALGFNMEIESNGKELTFSDVAIGKIPEFLTIVVSPIEALNTNGGFRDKCAATAAASPEDCAPPMLNIGVLNPSMASQDNSAQIAGVITLKDTADTLGVVANPPTSEPLPNLFHKPSLGGWVNEEGDGTADIRISIRNKRLGTSASDPTALAAQIALRMKLPTTLEIDPIGSWERKGSGAVSQDPGVNRKNFYEARDLNFGIRGNLNGSTDFSLGRLALAYENADTRSEHPTYLLVSDSNPANFGGGSLLPGVTELTLYQRDDKGEGNLLVQVDARLSKPLSVGVRLVDADPASRLPRAAFRAAGLPGGAGAGTTARIRANIITPAPDLPNDTPKPDFIDREAAGNSDCNVAGGICAAVRLGGIDVGLDLANSSVKRVDATARITGERNGIEIKGFDAIAGGNLAEIPSVDAALDLKRLRVKGGNTIKVAEVPLGAFEFDYDAQMIIPLSFKWARHIQVWHDKLAVNAQAHASGEAANTRTTGQVGPVEHHVRKLHASGHAAVLTATEATYKESFGYNQRLLATRCGGKNVGITQWSVTPNRDDGFIFLDPIADGVQVIGAGGLGDPSAGFAYVPGLLHNNRVIQTIARDNLCNMSLTIPIMVGDLPGDPLRGDHELVFALHHVPSTAASGAVAAPPTPPAFGTGSYTLGFLEYLHLCGTHSVKSLEIPRFSGIFVSPRPVATLTPWGTPACAPGSEGRLTLMAETVNIHGDQQSINNASAGFINANGVWGETSSQFNSGGGHAGRGGVGTFYCEAHLCFRDANGTVVYDNDPAAYAGAAPATGDRSRAPQVAPGSAGGFSRCGVDITGSQRRGCGGGSITLRAHKVIVNGSVTADGSDGLNAISGGCGAGRQASGGGGAGGGIAFDVMRVEGAGLIAARGGHGGGDNASDGFPGGGGSGGVVKQGFLWHATAPIVNRQVGVDGAGSPIEGGSTGGASFCSGPNDSFAQDGEKGVVIYPTEHRSDFPGSVSPNRVASTVHPVDKVWRPGGPIRFGFNVAAPASENAWVWLCQASVDPSELAPGEDPLAKLHAKYLDESALRADFPEKICGDAGMADVAPMFVQNNAAFFAEGGPAPNDDGRIDAQVPVPGGGTRDEQPLFGPMTISSGYHAFWTVAAGQRADRHGTNCSALPFGSGDAYKAAFEGCVLEVRPQGGPDVVVAVDNHRPAVVLSPPALPGYSIGGGTQYLTNKAIATFGVSAIDHPSGAAGLERVVCTVGGVAHPCWDGESSRVALPSDGEHEVAVHAYDRAGNVSLGQTVTFRRDVTPIQGSAAIERSAGDEGKAGWHWIPPNVRLSRSASPYGDLDLGIQHFEYRFDGGDPGFCSFAANAPDPECVAAPPADLGSGNHRFYWGGVDGAGNRQGLSEPHEPCDLAHRCLVVKIDRFAPQGTAVVVPGSPNASGWYTKPASVVIDVRDEPGGSGRGALKYTKRPADVSILGDDDALEYDGPIEVGAGRWVVCGVTEDESGHKSTSEQCVTLNVDTNVPTANVSFNGLSLPQPPGGQASQWQQNAPTIVISDPSDEGSGLVQDRPIAYRVNGGDETRCNAPCTVDPSKMNTAGRHLVTWTVRDIAGNERPLGRGFVTPQRPPPYPAPGTIPVAIDKAAPTLGLSVAPSAGPSGWITSTPTVAVSAVDSSPGGGISGSDALLHIDGNETMAPATLDDGVHQVCGSTADRAGRTAESCVTAKVDTVAPTADLSVSGTEGKDGWWLGSPMVTINNVADAGSGLSDTPVRYRVDDGDTVDCAATCVIPGDHFDEGHHVVRFQAVDVAGNYSEEQSRDILVDDSAPEVDLGITPASQGPWSASALYMRPTASDEGSGVAEASYTIDGSQVQGGRELVERIGTGTHLVCHSATDRADRNRVGCTTVRADSATPVLTLHEPIGWQRGPYTLPITVLDSDSGVVLSPSTSCGSILPPAEQRVGGVCVSIDGGPFTALTTPSVTLGEGPHEVRAFAIDGAGHRSLVTTARANVDSVAPTSTARARVASVGEWWRHVPLVAIDGADGSSGLDRVEYRFGPSDPWKVYTEPLRMSADTPELYHRAVDRSGLVSEVAHNRVAFDRAAPAVVPSSLKPSATPAPRATTGTKLRWKITDVDSPNVQVTVVVRDAFGNVVRRINQGTFALVGGTATGGASWAGQGDGGNVVAPGPYTYRVVARDESGKMTESTDSEVVVLV